ncbi:hypothetical protein [Bifidobacterium sp. SO1]|uniref:hypothetical protein n=1 Tax=Bifidobacterium sp. SO1 TaxID=2809029 RepID=UPI001F0A76DA|nr:hypothetical protein [Bifidobacterium sp. SO1]
MATLDTDELAKKTMETITVLAKLPVVRVDRDAFLRKQFAKSPYLDQILENGPQSVYTPDSLRRKADKVIAASTNSTSLTSFIAGLPSNPVTMVAAGGGDIVQYFGFALNMAQKLAYLFGDDDLFSNDIDELSETTQARVIAYLGAMLGVSGSAALILAVSKRASANIGKKVAGMALTKTFWYLPMKKVAALIGSKITKQTIQSAVTHAVPVIGGFVSGSITYFTFKPMGKRFADMLVRRAKGELTDEDDLELNPEFKERLQQEDPDCRFEDGKSVSVLGITVDEQDLTDSEPSPETAE